MSKKLLQIMMISVATSALTVASEPSDVLPNPGVQNPLADVQEPVQQEPVQQDAAAPVNLSEMTLAERQAYRKNRR